LTQLKILTEALKESNEYPKCCLTFHLDGKISCDVLGPLPRGQFLKECKRCRESLQEFVKLVDSWIKRNEGMLEIPEA
jgi:hypothetical protein